MSQVSVFLGLSSVRHSIIRCLGGTDESGQMQHPKGPEGIVTGVWCIAVFWPFMLLFSLDFTVLGSSKKLSFYR